MIKRIVRRLPGVKQLKDIKHLAKDKGILQLEKGQLEADVRNFKHVSEDARTFLAHRFIKGAGIEVGAAHHPLELPPKAKVKYVDVFTAADLRKAFPIEYENAEIVDIDVVDDGEKLSKFKANSLDFIIANHFLEHCLDPIGTLLNMYTKLRKNGVLFMAVPDMRYTFDRKRQLTTYDHLLEEHKDKTKKKFREEHTREYVKLAIPIDQHFNDTELKSRSTEAQIQHFLNSDYRIHYHVWTQREITELFARISQDFKIHLEIEAVLKNEHEVIYVLRKGTKV